MRQRKAIPKETAHRIKIWEVSSKIYEKLVSEKVIPVELIEEYNKIIKGVMKE